jgi:hypothetical protein
MNERADGAMRRRVEETPPRGDGPGCGICAAAVGVHELARAQHGLPISFARLRGRFRVALLLPLVERHDTVESVARIKRTRLQ